MGRLLDVFLHSQRVGQLEQDDSGSLWFGYSQEWLETEHAVPLSLSLPLRQERFKRSECRPFFAGLLPEDLQRHLIARSLGVSENNDFVLLDKIGGECAGAVTLLPTGSAAPESLAWEFQPLTQTDLDAKITELPKRPLLAGQKGLRLSLAGAQCKLALTVRPEGYAIPLHGAPSSHILKPQSPHFENLVENELLCMELAAAVGLSTASVKLGNAGQTAFLEIERYDRIQKSNGNLERLHQEDFCQALGLPPERKYEQEGGPSLRQCFELIRTYSSAPALDVLQLMDAAFFNCLIGNGDAHGKNFSLLYRNHQVRLAPLYDLVCTHAYPQLDSCYAMKIGKERHPEKIRSSDFQIFIREAGMNENAALKRMTGLLKKTAKIVSEWPIFSTQKPVVDSISRNIEWISRSLSIT
jgi:serine/threonine-protein kinase HipA